MQLGLVGLGKMGGNMRERIRRAGHEVIGYDRDRSVSDASSLADLVKRLEAPRVVWVMVPSGAPTRETVASGSGLTKWRRWSSRPPSPRPRGRTPGSLRATRQRSSAS